MDGRRVGLRLPSRLDEVGGGPARELASLRPPAGLARGMRRVGAPRVTPPCGGGVTGAPPWEGPRRPSRVSAPPTSLALGTLSERGVGPCPKRPRSGPEFDSGIGTLDR